MADKPEETAPEKVPVSRREALNFAWLASLGFLECSLGAVGDNLVHHNIPDDIDIRIRTSRC